MREGWAKTAAFAALRVTGVLAAAERVAVGVPILAYHGVTSEDDPVRNHRRLHVPRRRFEAHLSWLARHRRPLPLAEVVATLRGGRELPRDAVVVTFDDGYQNFLTDASDALRRHGVPATVFVVTHEPAPFWQDRCEEAVLGTELVELTWRGRRYRLDSWPARLRSAGSLMRLLDGLGPGREHDLEELCRALGRLGPWPGRDADRKTMSWEEIRSLRRSGVEVGAHADRHQPLSERPLDQLLPALQRSRARLEQELGAGPFPLSYPYGDRNRQIVDAARSAGFTCALSTESGPVVSGRDEFDLPRNLLGADDDVTRLRASLAGLRAFFQG